MPCKAIYMPKKILFWVSIPSWSVSRANISAHTQTRTHARTHSLFAAKHAHTMTATKFSSFQISFQSYSYSVTVTVPKAWYFRFTVPWPWPCQKLDIFGSQFLSNTTALLSLLTASMGWACVSLTVLHRVRAVHCACMCRAEKDPRPQLQKSSSHTNWRGHVPRTLWSWITDFAHQCPSKYFDRPGMSVISRAVACVRTRNEAEVQASPNCLNAKEEYGPCWEGLQVRPCWEGLQVRKRHKTQESISNAREDPRLYSSTSQLMSIVSHYYAVVFVDAHLCRMACGWRKRYQVCMDSKII